MTAFIESKPLTYKGITFRSTLEARWAVFLDAIQIKWRYEDRSFRFGSVAYLPDFYLEADDSFIEVKPRLDADIAKPKLMAAAGHKITVMGGEPRVQGAWTTCMKSGLFASGKNTTTELRLLPGARFAVCELCGKCDLCFVRLRCRFICDCGGTLCSQMDESPFPFVGWLKAAIDLSSCPASELVERAEYLPTRPNVVANGVTY